MINHFLFAIFRCLFCTGLLLIATFGFSQSAFPDIDARSKTVPESLVTHAEIAAHLTHKLVSEKEKVRAIFFWIAHNIRYDLNKLQSGPWIQPPEGIVAEALKNRQGVCQHYAELFHAMVRSVGFKAYLITGYTRNIHGEIVHISHIWNTVEIDGKFYLFDVTWAAGYVEKGRYVHEYSDQYFMVPPDEFIHTHMPYDPLWQLLSNPVSHAGFATAHFTGIQEGGSFSVRDSILWYEAAGELSRLHYKKLRINSDMTPDRPTKLLLDNKLNEITMAMYNIAVENLNEAVLLYNNYVIHKNNRFRNPRVDDTLIQQWMEEVGSSLNSAISILEGLNTSDQKLNKMISDANKSLAKIKVEFERENEFVDRYLSTQKPMRIFLF